MAFGDKDIGGNIPPGLAQVEREAPLAERVLQLTQRMNTKDSEINELQGVIRHLADFIGFKLS
jgi:hypothetical protein